MRRRWRWRERDGVEMMVGRDGGHAREPGWQVVGGGAAGGGVETCTESVVPEAMDGLDIFDDPTETLRQARNELNALIDAGQEASSSSRFAQAWRQRDCILLELEERLGIVGAEQAERASAFRRRKDAPRLDWLSRGRISRPFGIPCE